MPRGTKGRDTRGSCGPLSQPGFKGTETGVSHLKQCFTLLRTSTEKVTLGAAGEAGSQLPLFTGSFRGTSFGSRDPGKTPLCFKKLKEANGGLPGAAEDQ